MEIYGAIPAWSTKQKYKRKLIEPWKYRRKPPITFYGRCMAEKIRFRYHHNVQEKRVRRYIRVAYRKKNEYPMVTLQQIFESRLDNVVWRLGLMPTMSAARKFVTQGHMEVIRSPRQKEWRQVTTPGMQLRIGDKVRVSPVTGAKRHIKHHEERAPRWANDKVQGLPPPNLRWDPEKMEAEYLDLCDPEDFGIDIKSDYVLNWYAGQTGHLKKCVRRRHMRFFAGTGIPIRKAKNGGRVRPTPENLMNMARGIGLNARGANRPPCLWGRRLPINKPGTTGVARPLEGKPDRSKF